MYRSRASSSSSRSAGSGANPRGRRQRLSAGIRNLFHRSPSEERGNVVASDSPAIAEALALQGHAAGSGSSIAIQGPVPATGAPSATGNPVIQNPATNITVTGGSITGSQVSINSVTGIALRGAPAIVISPTGSPTTGIQASINSAPATALTCTPVMGGSATGSQASGNPVASIACMSAVTTGELVTGNSPVATPSSSSLLSNSSSKSPWETALAKLSPEDHQALDLSGPDKLVILDKVLEATKEKRDICRQKQWKYTWKGESIVLRDVADKLFVWVDKFKSIGNVVVSFDPIHAALPWAGFRFLLQVVVDDNQKMGAMLVALEAIANLMGRCAIYETLYLGNGTRSAIKLEEEMVGLYVCILRFLVQAKKYYSTNTAARVAFSIFDTEQMSLLGDIDKQEALVLKTTALAEVEYKRLADRLLKNQISSLDGRIIEQSKELLVQFSIPISRMESYLKDLSDGLQDAERTEILLWLSQVEYAKHHLNACEGRVTGTGEWLLRKKAFLEWQKSSASTILWLRGIPGAGKTKLTSRVIDKLRQPGSPISDEALAYFYCKRDETGPTDPEVVMSAIVKQLSCLRVGLPLQKAITSMYEARKKSGFASNSLRFQESLDLIISLVNTYPQTTIVVDALDECDPKKRKGFLDSLRFIVESTTSLVKIFVSSRNDDDIVLRLEDIPNFWIEAKDNEADIERFVQEEIASCIEKRVLLRVMSQELKGKIITSLTKGSQGIIYAKINSLRFLWVDLQIKEICSMDMAPDIEARLGKLPETLENTYTEIYGRILSQQGSSPQLAKSALMWVMCSCRPFSPDELATMVSLGSNIGGNLRPDTLFKLCHNLLVLDHQLNTVRFAHLSIREFLENTYFNTIDAHSEASKFCLSYLMGPRNPMVNQEPTFNTPCDESPAIKYTICYWPIHVQQCLDQEKNPELPNLLIKFLETSILDWQKAFRLMARNISELRQGYERISGFSPLLPLQVASVFGFGEKIGSLWGSGPWNLNAKGPGGETVLYIASVQRDHWIVEALLGGGADVNAQGGEYGNALQAAAIQAGNEKVVELLLEKGADVNAQGGEYGNALQAAASEAGNEKVVELLLEKGADVNAQGGGYGNALQAAASVAGNEKVVELLLEKGADVNAQGGKYWNALRAARRMRNRRTVELLLSRGAKE